MNIKLIVFSGLMTALVGAIGGLAMAEISGSPYVSEPYQNLPLKYALAGAALGAAVGVGQESVRELNKQQSTTPPTSTFLNRHEP